MRLLKGKNELLLIKCINIENSMVYKLRLFIYHNGRYTTYRSIDKIGRHRRLGEGMRREELAEVRVRVRVQVRVRVRVRRGGKGIETGAVTVEHLYDIINGE